MARKHNHAVRRGDGFIEERTTKTGDPRWVARWHDGTKWRGETFRTLDEAERKLHSVGGDKRTGRYTPDSEMTVSELVAEYIKRGASRWSENTTANYRQIARTIVDPSIGSKRIRNVSPRTIQNWVDDLSDHYSPARIEVIRAVVGGAFAEAERLDLVPRNPVRGIRGPKGTRSKKETWTQEEAGKVVAYVRDDPELYAFYRVALSTGMRPGEMRALRWQDVDTAGSTITVRHSVSRDAEFRPVIGKTTKTGKVRAIAVPASTIDALQRWRSVYLERRLQAPFWRDLDLVFPRPDGNVLPQQTIAKRHNRVCDGAGVPRISPHGMRHTYATMSMAAGIPVKVVSEALGHASVKTTLDIYQHVDATMQRSAAELLGDILDKGAV